MSWVAVSAGKTAMNLLPTDEPSATMTTELPFAKDAVTVKARTSWPRAMSSATSTRSIDVPATPPGSESWTTEALADVCAMGAP